MYQRRTHVAQILRFRSICNHQQQEENMVGMKFEKYDSAPVSIFGHGINLAEKWRGEL